MDKKEFKKLVQKTIKQDRAKDTPTDKDSLRAWHDKNLAEYIVGTITEDEYFQRLLNHSLQERLSTFKSLEELYCNDKRIY